MYRLHVIHAGTAWPTEIISIRAAAEVLTAIPDVLDKHPDCARLEVMLGHTRLFAVDCKGARLED